MLCSLFWRALKSSRVRNGYTMRDWRASAGTRDVGRRLATRLIRVEAAGVERRLTPGGGPNRFVLSSDGPGNARESGAGFGVEGGGDVFVSPARGSRFSPLSIGERLPLVVRDRDRLGESAERRAQGNELVFAQVVGVDDDLRDAFGSGAQGSTAVGERNLDRSLVFASPPAFDEARGLGSFQERREGSVVELEELSDSLHRRCSGPPEHEHDQVLRIRQLELVEERAVALASTRGGVDRPGARRCRSRAGGNGAPT
jgi:hypothetical protein